MTAKYILRVFTLLLTIFGSQSLLPRCIVGSGSGLFLSSFANTSKNKSPAFLIEIDHNLFVYFHYSLR